MKLANASSVRTTMATVSARDVNTSVEGELPLERFFPGVFAILLPVVISAIPKILDVFREGPASSDETSAVTGQTTDRFIPELLTILGPLLSAIVPVLIQQIQSADREITDQTDEDRNEQPEDVDADEQLERILPDLLGAIVPTLVRTLRAARKESAVQFDDGNTGVIPETGPHLIRSEVSSRFLGTLLQVLLPAISTVLPQLFDLINGGGAGSQPREIGISWAALKNGSKLDNRDTIKVKLAPIDDPDGIEIVLKLGSQVSWWKGIQVRNSNGVSQNEIGAQDGRSNRMTLSADEADDLISGGSLAFGKAEMFGIHAWKYTLPASELREMRGKRATFRWTAD